MDNFPVNEDLRVFVTVARLSSFALAAKRLDVSHAYVSKRIAVLERTLKVKLLHRTTRRVSVTNEGERVFVWACRILDGVDQLMQEVAVTRASPQGLLRVSCSFGFGRKVVGPMLSRIVERHSQLQICLEVFDKQVDAAGDGFDLDVRVGEKIAPHMIARQLAKNSRVLCASPSYVARHGEPKTLDDLSAHDCLFIREHDNPFGVWTLRDGADERSIKVTGSLSSNNGEIVVQWAVDGRGVILRSLWDVAPLLQEGKLVQVLPNWVQDANIYATYPSRLETSAKVRVTVEFLQEEFGKLALAGELGTA